MAEQTGSVADAVRAPSNRERFLRLMAGGSLDRGIFANRGGSLDEWRPLWVSQGMPADFGFGFGDTLEALEVNLLFQPPFEIEVLEEEGQTQVVLDQCGVIKRVFKGRPGELEQFLEYPVADRASWEALRPRLDADEVDLDARLPADWAQRAAALNEQSDAPVVFGCSHLCGFFSFLRELMGDRAYYAFYDAPDLVREILEVQVHRLTTLLARIARDIRIDMQFIFEDMCYRNGPLVGPAPFREFLLEPYQSTIAAAKECGVRAFCVHSDGQVDVLIPLRLEAASTCCGPWRWRRLPKWLRSRPPMRTYSYRWAA